MTGRWSFFCDLDKSTSRFVKFGDNEFKESHLSTIGLDYRFKTIEYEELKIKLQIWDTAGQDKFRSITQSYYKGAHGILLLFDITNLDSFLNVKQWISQIRENSPKEIILFIIGNKVDKSDRAVEYEEAKAFADEVKASYLETSAKENINIQEAFSGLYKEIFDKNSKSGSSKEQLKKGKENNLSLMKKLTKNKEECCKK